MPNPFEMRTSFVSAETGDGVPELVALNQGNHDFTLLTGTGAGSFANPQTEARWLTPARPTQIVAGDFTFEVDLARGPPEDGMEGEDSFENALEEKGVVVAAGEMCCFVKDDLVETAEEWPGVNAFEAIVNDQPLTAVRPALRHVIVVMLENRSYTQLAGNPAAPFQARLARECGNATEAFAATHGSAPNYLAVSAGQYPSSSVRGCAYLACVSNEDNI